MDPSIQICKINSSFKTHIYHFDIDENRLLVNSKNIDNTKEYKYDFMTFDKMKNKCDFEKILDINLHKF